MNSTIQLPAVCHTTRHARNNLPTRPNGGVSLDGTMINRQSGSRRPPNRPRWNPHHYVARRHIPRNDSSRADHCSRPNSYSGQQDCASSHIDIALQRNRPCSSRGLRQVIASLPHIRMSENHAPHGKGDSIPNFDLRGQIKKHLSSNVATRSNPKRTEIALCIL